MSQHVTKKEEEEEEINSADGKRFSGENLVFRITRL